MRSPLLLAAAALVALALFSSAAMAQLRDENLLVSMPEGYKIGFQNKAGGVLITEMVPAGETVENWTEMVTVQILFGNKIPPVRFEANIKKLWAASCSGSSAHPIFSGDERGYPVALWFLSCPLNKQTGKPEHTWMKAIGGNDSLYVVQKAFKFMPSKEQIDRWMQYLKKAAVCDTRRPDRSCPAAWPR